MKASTRWGQANSLQHVCRTTLSAVASLAVASLLTMPEAYWAAITALIVTQSDLKSTLSVSARRLIGTALGATLGAVILKLFGPTLPGFGLGVLLCGVACIAIGHASKKLSGYLDRTAYRYAGITLAVILLIPRSQNIWWVALDRFIEVSVGIVLALAVTMMWPEEPWNEETARNQ